MQRHERQDRTHARAVGAGILISAAVHVAAFALIRFGVPALAVADEDALAAEPEAPAVEEPVMQVIALREAPAVDAPAPEPTTPAAATPEPAVQAAAPAAPAPEPSVAMAEVVEVPAAALPSAEPDAAPGGAVLPGEPAVADAQPDALVPEPAAADAEEEEYDLPAGVPLHVPGSVGRAKGQWGAAAGGEDEERRGRTVIIRVGKCPPLPGRGRRPPVMRPPVNQHLVHPAGW